MKVYIITAYTLPYKIEYECPYCGTHVSENWNTFATKYEINLYDQRTWPTTISCHACKVPVDVKYEGNAWGRGF